jgi:hypothetical protein
MRRSTVTGLLVIGMVVGFVPAAPAAPEPALTPGLVQAMRRDLGLDEQQAKTRIRQESIATKIAPAATTAAGDAFGGTWFDADKGTLVVALTDEGKAAAVRATGAETAVAKHSAAKLNAVKSGIDQESTLNPVPIAVIGWHVDARRSAVVVDVQPGARSAEVDAFISRIEESGPVVVNTEGVQAPKTLAAGTVGGDPFYTGNVRCSIGFSVHGGYVTAGHCGGGGAAVYGWDRSYQGNFGGSSFPGNDFAFVRTGGGWWNVPVVLGWGQVSDALVRGSWEAPPGTSVCRSGSTTHWHCGVIQGRNETVNYAQGAVYEMVGTSVCAEGGDSGGSFITGDQAQGVTSGGYGNCSSGGRTWFQPVNEILRVYGLTLLTA